MKKRLVMGTLTAALIAGSVPYEIYAQQEEVVIQSEEEGQEEPSEPEQPEPAPSEEPQPTMEPEPTQAPEPTVEPEPTQAPAPTETPEEPTATPVPGHLKALINMKICHFDRHWMITFIFS